MNSGILNSNKKVRLSLVFLIFFFTFIVINGLFKEYFDGEIQIITAIIGGLGLATFYYIFDKSKT
jgi:positive regulator of sigma E activity